MLAVATPVKAPEPAQQSAVPEKAPEKATEEPAKTNAGGPAGSTPSETPAPAPEKSPDAANSQTTSQSESPNVVARVDYSDRPWIPDRGFEQLDSLLACGDAPVLPSMGQLVQNLVSAQSQYKDKKAITAPQLVAVMAATKAIAERVAHDPAFAHDARTARQSHTVLRLITQQAQVLDALCDDYRQPEPRCSMAPPELIQHVEALASWYLQIQEVLHKQCRKHVIKRLFSTKKEQERARCFERVLAQHGDIITETLNKRRAASVDPTNPAGEKTDAEAGKDTDGDATKDADPPGARRVVSDSAASPSAATDAATSAAAAAASPAPEAPIIDLLGDDLLGSPTKSNDANNNNTAAASAAAQPGVSVSAPSLPAMHSDSVVHSTANPMTPAGMAAALGGPSNPFSPQNFGGSTGTWDAVLGPRADANNNNPPAAQPAQQPFAPAQNPASSPFPSPQNGTSGSPFTAAPPAAGARSVTGTPTAASGMVNPFATPGQALPPAAPHNPFQATQSEPVKPAAAAPAGSPPVYNITVQANGHAVPGSQPGMQAVSNPYTQTGMGAVSNPYTQTGMGAVSNPYTQTGMGAVSNPYNQTGMGAVSNPYTQTGMGAVSNPYTQTGMGAVSNPYTQTGVGAVSNPYTQTGMGAVSNPYTQTGMGAVSNPYTQTGAQAVSNPYTQTGAQAVNNPYAQTPAVNPFQQPAAPPAPAPAAPAAPLPAQLSAGAPQAANPAFPPPASNAAPTSNPFSAAPVPNPFTRHESFLEKPPAANPFMSHSASASGLAQMQAAPTGSPAVNPFMPQSTTPASSPFNQPAGLPPRAPITAGRSPLPADLA